jgi:hypothetical protein
MRQIWLLMVLAPTLTMADDDPAYGAPTEVGAQTHCWQLLPESGSERTVRRCKPSAAPPDRQPPVGFQTKLEYRDMRVKRLPANPSGIRRFLRHRAHAKVF